MDESTHWWTLLPVSSYVEFIEEWNGRYPWIAANHVTVLKRCDVNEKLNFRAEAEINLCKKHSLVSRTYISSFTGQNMEVVGVGMSFRNILWASVFPVLGLIAFFLPCGFLPLSMEKAPSSMDPFHSWSAVQHIEEYFLNLLTRILLLEDGLAAK